MATALQMPNYGNSSYQTAPLQDYSQEFQALARRLFQRVGIFSRPSLVKGIECQNGSFLRSFQAIKPFQYEQTSKERQ